MNESKQLADFQAALLEILARDESPEQLLERMNRHPACEPYRDYLASFELKMVEVAAELVKKWGVRSRSTEEG